MSDENLDRTKWEQLCEVVNACKDDAGKCYGKSNASAGNRLRKACQVIRQLAKEVRAETITLAKANKASKSTAE